MGFVFDLIIVAIAVICIVYGAKKGFFKSLMSLISGILALLIALTFTPLLSESINDKYVKGPISGGIETMFLSIAESGSEDVAYDTELLFKDSQFVSLMEGAGLTDEKIREEEKESTASAEAFIKALAVTVATPIAKTVSDICAFIILFAVALVILKLATLVLGLFMKLPVLRETDKVMGVVFGIISAVFFSFVFSMMVSRLASAMAVAAPGTFKTDIVENSFLLNLLSKYNPVSLLSGLLIG